MASAIPDQPRPESGPALTLDDEKPGHESSTPTLYDEKPDTPSKPQDEPEPEDETDIWVTGWKLTSLMISITIGAFLMLLDMSIVTTVRLFGSSQVSVLTTIAGYPSHHREVSLFGRHWLVWQCIQPSQVCLSVYKLLLPLTT
jgi:hypothetical protein